MKVLNSFNASSNPSFIFAMFSFNNIKSANFNRNDIMIEGSRATNIDSINSRRDGFRITRISRNIDQICSYKKGANNLVAIAIL